MGANAMELLEKRILKDGKVAKGDVLKVGNFLNQQIDVTLNMQLGEEIARLYKDAGVTKVLTIEASGIALATAVAFYLGVPLVYAKKDRSINQNAEVYHATVFSYTHQYTYEATVATEYLRADDTVLVVDDFLATGGALHGLLNIVETAGARLAGCAIAIEKGFQGGGDQLRAKGIRVESMAIIDRMSEEEGIIFRH